ncbi:MAG: hypothetical protein OZ948_18415 [Deltaproteobacteria bacterium]|nr:hypothetical protein [Deltaproteobacteria bacterium]
MRIQGIAALAVCVVGGFAGQASGADESGGRIGYLAPANGYWQAWIQELGGDPRQITGSPGDKTRCSWFPDGKAMLVSSTAGEVVRVGLDSLEETKLPLPRGIHDAAVSPDGDRIAFSMSPGGTRDANEIFVAAPDGSAMTRLTRLGALQHEPAWSPDGKWIYFLSGDGGQAHDIWRVSVDGSAQEQLTAGELYHFDVAAGPRGLLAFSGNRGGRYAIWVKPAAGASRVIAGDAAFAAGPSFAGDGRELAFERAVDGGASAIFRTPVDGSGSERLVVGAPARRPCWEPARRRLR